ncbi:flhB hrpN yscU spaS family domain-containing protein [Ditylenchus destructor]|uniref:FlhB hrpN yscU spaS family domain-containing protein n=1 Tax=Ditylenchus destructor TaxID=166010 RepID=A0AAD4MEB1_9BILA|nr:flhB hrpN yscU spaS family domain-containing protein [Ditylenchus destructor]
MADKNQGGDKTEKPTRKRLRDARNKGDIAKSKDLSSAISMIAWLPRACHGEPFEATLATLGASAFGLVVLVAGLVLVPAAAAGLIAEFLQTGALITTEKMKPQLGNLDPVEGLKRMFNPDNLFELLKTLIKAALILTIIWVVLSGSIDEVRGDPPRRGVEHRGGSRPQDGGGGARSFALAHAAN